MKLKFILILFFISSGISHANSINASSLKDYPSENETNARFDGYAPPNFYGGWKTIASHCGPTSYRISYTTVNSNTHVVAIVSYFAGPGRPVQSGFSNSITIRPGDVCASVKIKFKGIPYGSAVKGIIN